MKRVLIAGLIVLFLIVLLAAALKTGLVRSTVLQLTGRSGSGLSIFGEDAPDPTVVATPFTPVDVQVGDADASYVNVETYGNYPYLVWFEQMRQGGTVWHCGIDPETAELIPADCRGFMAFESTALNRANIGIDAKGLYYVGATPEGAIKLVRPTGPASGTVTDIATPPDPRRRAYYPSLLPGSNKQYLAWILNEEVAASGLDERNDWIELQYIDLADPATVYAIERQDKPGRRFAPIDSAFFRWFQDKAALTYGAYSEKGIDIKEFDVATGRSAFVTNDGLVKADPYPWVFAGREILMPGINTGAYGYIYARPAGGSGLFEVAEEIITPAESALEHPILAQSFQPLVWGGKAYAAYQVNDRGGGAITSFFQIFSKTGEIWLTTVLEGEQKQWLLTAPNDLVKSEPEPFVGTNAAWVFYSATEPGSRNPITAKWQLRRASTPLAK